jgi:hypothetical protein
VVIREYELMTRDLVPIKLTFELHEEDDEMSRISTNRKGLNRLKEMMPETFGAIKDDDDGKIQEINIEVKPYSKLQPKTA